jgi:hypothetical protein
MPLENPRVHMLTTKLNHYSAKNRHALSINFATIVAENTPNPVAIIQINIHTIRKSVVRIKNSPQNQEKTCSFTCTASPSENIFP